MKLEDVPRPPATWRRGGGDCREPPHPNHLPCWGRGKTFAGGAAVAAAEAADDCAGDGGAGGVGRLGCGWKRRCGNWRARRGRRRRNWVGRPRRALTECAGGNQRGCGGKREAGGGEELAAGEIVRTEVRFHGSDQVPTTAEPTPPERGEA